MSDLVIFSDGHASLIFLKATVKKQVFVPTYTRHDGVTVPGHYALVHVSDSHDERKILAGQGSYSQKAAHAQLSKHDWFNALPNDHKVPVLLKHATEIQDKESAAATLSTFKKKILSAKTPSLGEWKVFHQAPEDKKKSIHDHAEAGGALPHLTVGYENWKAANAANEAVAQPTEKEDPKVALKAALLDKITAANLPESNVNHKAVNGKLAAIHAATTAEDIQALLYMGYGSNTYGVKAVKLANEALAVLGSPHQVASGQKPGQHHALHAAPPTSTPSPKPQAPAKLIGAKHAEPAPKQPAPHAPAPEPESGPKDGDTKPGADGDMLVFQYGRWHKQNNDAVDAKKPDPPFVWPKPGSAKQISVQVSHFINTDPGHNKFWQSYVDGFNLVTSYGKIGSKGAQTSKTFATAALAKLAEAKLIQQKLANGYQKQSVKHTLVDPSGATPAAPAKLVAAAPKPTSVDKKKPSPAAASAPVVAPQVVKDGKVAVMQADGWLQTGPQKGSNPGGKFKDKKGVEWYCKFPSDPDMARNELLAAKFYTMLGAKVPTLALVQKDGKLGIASKWVDGLKTGAPAQLAKAPGALESFVFDAWLANWDVVGLGNDNLLLDGKSAVRVDVGGSILYRAMGGVKGEAFGDTVPELDTLLDPVKNGKSAAVFSGISQQTLRQGAQTLAKMRDGQIKKMVDLFGPGDAAAKAALTKKLVARRLFILKTYGIADPWNKPTPDMTKLTVNHADLPAPIDFTNYKGSGKGLSSKEHLNKQNTVDDAALIAFAKKGNLTALKNYQYEAFDKESGKSLGKKPITDHPSKDIKEHWAYLVELLDSIAHPSVIGLDMPPLGSGSLEEIAAAAGYIPFGQRVATIPAEKRLGFWMKVAHAGEDFTDIVPKKTHWVSDAVKKASKAAWHKVGSVTKAFISEVQKSGWINHVFSEGKSKITAAGHGGNYHGGPGGLAAAAYQDAIELEEGTRLTRWMQMPASMMEQLLKEKPGLIFQNTDSMCTSMSPDWGKSSHFGSGAVLNIIYGKGAKALHSFATGNYSGEQEITTLMGQRFMLLNAKKGNASNPSGITLDLLMLPPHQGFVVDIENHAKMGKSFIVMLLNAFKGGWK
jgi:predicted DNA-binding WGR domain protein